MKKTLESNEYVVYDDVLEQQHFNMVRTSAEAEDYSIPHIEKWLKVWRISDGLTMGSKQYTFSKNESNIPNNHIGFMYNIFNDAAKNNCEVCGDWNKIILRSYLYGRDTKLSWHNDAGYCSAGIFYCHNYWGSTWGGELMLARTPILQDGQVPNPCIDHVFEDKFLEYYGFGQYITCKPNRLVLTKGGVWHSINRVDKDAGDHVRMTIVAFFVK